MNNITIPLFRNILLTLYENGCVSIAPQGNVGVLADKAALFDDKGFSVGVTQYRYGVAYAYKQERARLIRIFEKSRLTASNTV